MLKEIRPAIVMMVLLTVLTGLAYPLAMTGIAQLVFPRQANGSLIEKDGKVIIGSELIGQNFTERQVFPRPSVGDDGHRPEGRDQDGSRALQRRQLVGQQRRPDLEGADRARPGRRRQAQGGESQCTPFPVDLVTTSASGLDPDITPAAALFQVPRVAKARGLPEAKVRELVTQQDRRALPRPDRRAARQRAEAQHGARRFASRR